MQQLFFLGMACGGGAQRWCGSCVWARYLSTDCHNHPCFYTVLSNTTASCLWWGNHAVAYTRLHWLQGILGLLLAPWDPCAQWWRCVALAHVQHDLLKWTQWHALPGQDPWVHWLQWLLPTLEGSAEWQHAAQAFLWILQGSTHQYVYPFSPWCTYSTHSTAMPSPLLLISRMGRANAMKPILPLYSSVPYVGSPYPYPFGHTCCRQSYGGSSNMLRFQTIYFAYHMQIIIGTASFLYLDPFIRRWLLSLYYYIVISIIIVRYDLTWGSVCDTIYYKYNSPW